MPRKAKLVVMFALVWTLSPIDLIPEFIPVLGPLDDDRLLGQRGDTVAAQSED